MRLFAFTVLLAALSLAGCTGDKPTTLLDNERADFADRQAWPFTLAEATDVAYETESRNEDNYDVCIIPGNEVSFWTSGDDTRTFKCDEGVSRASDSVHLEAGDYGLALKCNNAIENCVVAVTLKAS